MISTAEDRQRVADRLRRERGIDLDPELVEIGREELDPEHEGNIIVDYGYDALVRYYCPNDPRLEKL
jgi:hypothetical protein